MTSRTTRYADPERCPDCRRPIALHAPRCDACGLPLHGPAAARLFQTLATADDLLVELRASVWPAPAPAPAALVPPAPAPARPSTPSRLRAASVPQVLLGLGALCVLVAALVFLAVAWSVMGVGGRTATLLVLTALAGGLGWSLARRELRAAAESLVLVSLGLLTLDLFGADHAGWLGALDVEGFLVVLGGALALAGTGLTLAVRRTGVGDLVGAQVVTGIGLALAASGLSDLDQGSTDADLLVTVVLALLAAESLRRLSLDLAAALGFVVAGLAWFVLLAAGAVRVVEHATYHELWLDLHAWPVVAAAALVAGTALVRSLPETARVAGVAVGVAVVVGAVVAPVVLDGDPTAATLTAFAVLVPAGLVAWFVPRPWGLAAVLVQALATSGVLLTGAWLATEGAARLRDVADGLPVTALAGPAPAAWLLPLCVVALAGTVASLHRPAAEPRACAGLLTAAVVLTATLYAWPAWLLVALALAAGLGFLAWWLRSRSLAELGLAAGFLLVGVALAEPSEVSLVVALALVLLATVAVHLDDVGLVGDVAGAVTAVTLAALAFAVGTLADAPETWVALVALLLLAALGATGRPGLEVGAAATALPVALAGTAAVTSSELVPTWAAVYLTVIGGAVTAVAISRPSRRLAAWPGGLLLAAATWVRLLDLGVREPEAYTLPSAFALLGVGLWQLHRRADSTTVTMLGPGLTLALVPSLVWSFADPTGLRALLLGLAALGLVLAGVRLRWTAPVVWGAATGALLVLRLAAPYVDDAVPRWVLIGAAGALLIATGVTWERRLHEARQLRDYVRGLR
jgi:hypothetical protein